MNIKNKKVILSIIGLILLSGILIFVYSKVLKVKTDTYTTNTSVYEVSANSASDCESNEVYNAKNKVCVFECSSEVECSNYRGDMNQR